MSRHPFVRSTTAVLATCAVAIVAASIAPASSASAPTSSTAGSKLPSQAYRASDYAHGQAMSILPPGENGNVTLTDLAAFEATGTRPANSQADLAKYENLLYGYQSVTDATLGKYYDDESFGVPKADVARTEDPSSTQFPAGDVLIERDSQDVPHIYGSTDEAASFGAGYAQAEDRLFLMDVLRHYGAGTLSSFIGPSCADEEMDHDQLLLAPYTEAQGNAQVNRLPKEYGAQGLLAKNMIDAYVDGINAWISHVTSPAGASQLDADYPVAAQEAPQKWTAADVVDIAGLIGGIFGKGGGIEVANSALYKYLQGKLGAKAGAKAFNEFKEQNDPSAQTTVVDKRFPYESVKHPNPKLTAIPDHPRAKLKGGPTDTTKGCSGLGSIPIAPIVTADIAALGQLPKQFSNAIVVDAKDTKAHHPIAVFGPQVSYFAPQILAQEEISAPGYHAEGASFPGTGIVELGRGEDYAWSATSAGSDLIDQRLELICNPKGGKAGATGKFYRYKGKCVAMKHEVFSESAQPKPGGEGDAATIHHNIYLTNDGIVQGWTTARHGKSVAVVNQRSTFNHDVDSVVGFLRWGEPKLTHSVKSWEQGAARIGYTFNWFYVDSKHAAYYVSGRDPVRAKHANPNLPTWGTGDAQWHGFLAPSRHVHETDPKQGFFVSWNNKPAPGFSAADDQYGYGPTYRSQMLVNRLKHQLKIHHHKLTRANVVQAMEAGATQDLDGLTVLPQLLKYVKGHKEPGGVKKMLSALTAWRAAGAHRHKAKPASTQYQQHAAIAIMDELEPNLVKSIYNRLLAGGGVGGQGSTGGATTPGYNILPMQFVNTPNSGDAHLGSSYDGGWEGYMQKTLQQLRGTHPRDPFTSIITSRWCGGGPATCRAAINEALLKTYRSLKSDNGTAAVASWTKDGALIADQKSTSNSGETMPQFDAISFRPLGIVGQPLIDWQNRPTFQQVVQFPAHRP
ncbi:MAG TPA: penicillin acylase family protein [Mycobacteriales bacterium]|nr:penicillin acylase family protein [Mycobacteriales bacterium]